MGWQREPRAGVIEVIVADDQTLVRHGIRSLLVLSGDIGVVAEASDGEEALRAVRSTRTDIVLLDVRMPRKTGLQVLEAMREMEAPPPAILLTTFDDDAVALEGIKLGTRGFLLKDVSLDQLTSAIPHGRRRRHPLQPGRDRTHPARHRPNLTHLRGGGAPRSAHPPRTRGAALDGGGVEQQGDRRRPLGRRGDHQESRVEHLREARRARPDTGRPESARARNHLTSAVFPDARTSLGPHSSGPEFNSLDAASQLLDVHF